MPCTFCADLGITNLVDSPTRGQSVLDLFLVSEEIANHFSVTVGCPISNSDHRTVVAIPRATINQAGQMEKSFYDIRKSNMSRLFTEIQKLNWHDFYISNESSDVKCRFFHEVIETHVDLHIPRQTVYLTDRDKPWITPFLKFCIQKRWDAYRRKNFCDYKYWKEKVQKEIPKAKMKWSRSAAGDSRSLWKMINSIRGTKSQDPLLRLCSQLGGAEKAVEVINTMFCNIYVPSNPMNNSFMDDEWDVELNEYDIIRRLQSIPDNKACGSDGIPTAVYKAISVLIAGPLCHIFSLCISERNFPRQWKYAFVSPIPKHGCLDINNLRPISLLPLPGKLLEYLVLSKGIRKALLDSFGQNQFGGRPNSSTSAALIKLYNDITVSLDQDDVGGVQLLAYDYTKAFDKLRHDVIVKALLDSKLPNGFIQFVISYLSDRQQATKIGNHISKVSSVTSGVPQGSILGPFLYCVVCAFLQPTHSTSTMIKYIDDIT